MRELLSVAFLATAAAVNGYGSGRFHTQSKPATIAVTPTNPTTAIVNVTATWANVANPSSDDWIGVFCPFTNDTTAFTTYIEVRFGIYKCLLG